MPVYRMTNAEVVSVSRFMETVITKTEQGVKYHKPWNDQKIAKKFGVTHQNVAYLRRSVFGDLAVVPKPAPKPKPKQIEMDLEPKATKVGLSAVIRDLRDAVAALESFKGTIGNLEDRLAYLERELGVTSQDKVL